MTSKHYWPVVGARIPPELKLKLDKKHPDKGSITQVITQLLEKYLAGKILGIIITKKTEKI